MKKIFLIAILLLNIQGRLFADSQIEDFNVKLQSTLVWQQKDAFTAPYSGTNSMSTNKENAYSWSITPFFGARLWRGAEAYFDPEFVQGDAISELHGLGGFTNGENQKGSNPQMRGYLARLFLRQSFNLGGESQTIESGQNQLAGIIDKRRLVLTLGRINITDIFDNNSFSHDPRTQFLNWSLMSQGAFDYAADTKGYTFGAALEFYYDDWAFRIGRFEEPKESNGVSLDTRLLKNYGDEAEIEKDYQINGKDGKARFLLFHNHAYMGSFQDAINYWKANAKVGVPDVGNVRKESDKYGYGLNLEQMISTDIGVFARLSNADGQTETYSFTEIERSISGGTQINGNSWRRPNDVFGVGYAVNSLSKEHQEYLADGGLGAFIGDGKINYRPEQIIETYYSMNLMSGLKLSVDYQHITNPAYNGDRGPANFYGTRIHFEY